MDKHLRLNTLYDYYKELFTEKQKEYFEDYYYSNLSLAEIAENYNVTRNAVHNQLKSVEEKLEEFEAVLQLVSKRESVINLLTGKVDKDIIDQIAEIL